MKFKKGDNVQILTGKDRGKKGKIIQVLPKANKVVVDGINMMTKNVRPRRSREKGQIVKYNAPLNASNVMLISSKSGKPTRVGYQVAGKKKTRYSHKLKEALD
ncbi:MAG: 50S ribosomal protein L24 [bacterium]